MKVKCKDCGNQVTKLKSSKRRQRDHFYYVDDNGRLWNGLQCPDCKLESSSYTENLERNESQDLESEIEESFIYC